MLVSTVLESRLVKCFCIVNDNMQISTGQTPEENMEEMSSKSH